MLETQVIDSGIGIDPDRQDLLFTPFLELKDRIGINKAQNDNIGLGLSCSKEICKLLGGDLKLKHSEKGMTVFTFKIPIIINDDDILSSIHL
jgi:signal transduction histidine kinase